MCVVVCKQCANGCGYIMCNQSFPSVYDEEFTPYILLVHRDNMYDLLLPRKDNIDGACHNIDGVIRSYLQKGYKRRNESPDNRSDYDADEVWDLESPLPRGTYALLL